MTRTLARPGKSIPGRVPMSAMGCLGFLAAMVGLGAVALPSAQAAASVSNPSTSTPPPDDESTAPLVAAFDQVRTAEGVGPLVLPTNWSSSTARWVGSP